MLAETIALIEPLEGKTTRKRIPPAIVANSGEYQPGSVTAGVQSEYAPTADEIGMIPP